jgi:hypothetical protein
MIEATYRMEQSAYLKWDPYSTLKGSTMPELVVIQFFASELKL